MIILWLCVLLAGSPEWGFFGHRLINRMAVYTLPTEMIGWYKPHIDYLAEHAVDPDKRRYATKHEAVRHYIDLDHWGSFPFDHMPQNWIDVLALNLRLYHIEAEEQVYILQNIPVEKWKDTIHDIDERKKLVREFYLEEYYNDPPKTYCDSIKLWIPGFICDKEYTLYMDDSFSEHGILPYHLQAMQHRLTNAFIANDVQSIIRLSAEIGHYIGDACVPLHTTSNYNGQLSGQIGIHAFWESRIPELFALEEFDMVVGMAGYIDDPAAYFWKLVLDSHQEVNRVLDLEKQLRDSYPSDKQFCFENRSDQLVKTQCTEFARAYHLAMDKMVEERFRIAVKALGDAWYTAWVDAGQPAAPDHFSVTAGSEDKELEKAFRGGKAKGRDHEN